MSTAAAGALFDERIDPGRIASALFAALVHLALLAVLVFGVRWQNRPPEAVTVELWEPPPPAPVVVAAPAPSVEPPPAPVVKAEAEIPQPDIALKAPPPAPAPKVVPKEAPKPVAKEVLKPVPKEAVKPAPKEAPRPQADEVRKRMQQQLAQDQASLAMESERQQIKDQLAREAASAQKRDYEAYAGRIKAKIRGNIVLPPDIQGNPEAVFLVVQLPTGEVLPPRLVKSSGHRGYDEAVERAILKSSPLPKPDRPELFERELKLTFRPKD
jgi:colicin import membrane protein